MKRKSSRIPPEVAAFIHFGWTVALLLTGSCLLGIYLDRKFNSSPIGLLILSALGISMAGYLFFSTVKKISSEGQNDKQT
jgi:F0F1-type ATP synthase assembly protein I